MINQSTGVINTLQYKIERLCYLKSFNPRHLLCAGVCYNKISSIMSAYCRVCFTIKAEKNISWFIVENKEDFNVENKEDLLIYLRLK